VRPRKKIDWEQFDKLCGLQCTQVEIASWFDCSVDTIERAVKREKKTSFADYYDLKRGKGRISLRRRQWEVAMQGNVSMLIWLGKQYLGQSDQVFVDDSGSETYERPESMKSGAA
jgi:hypothetical protein